MKIKKVISLLLASILLVSLELGIASTETVNDKSVSNESKDEKISNAEKYFEWDPNIKVDWGKLYLINLEIDKISWFFILELKDYTADYTFLNPSSKEKVVNVIPGTRDFRLYSYFDKDQEVVFNYETNFHSITGNKSDLQNYLFSRTDDYITLGEVADIMVNLKQFDISDYYLKSRLLTLEDFQYNNTVTSKNDGLFIKKEDLFIMCSRDDNNSGNDKLIFLRISEKRDQRNFALFDLFTDEKIAELIKAKFNFFENSFNISNKKIRQVRV